MHLDQYPQDASKAQKLADGGYEDEDGETSVLEAPETNVDVGPMPQGASSDSVQVVASPQETDKQHKWEQFQIRAKTSRAFGLQGTDPEASIDSQERKPVGELEYFTDHSHNPLPEHSPPTIKASLEDKLYRQDLCNRSFSRTTFTRTNAAVANELADLYTHSLSKPTPRWFA